MLDTKVRFMFRTCKACEIYPPGFKVTFEKILKDMAFDNWISHIKDDDTFKSAYLKLKLHFDTIIKHQRYYKDWTSSTLRSIKSDSDNALKTPREILQILFSTLTKAQKALGPPWDTDQQFQAAIIKACRGPQDFEMALSVPKPNAEELMQQIAIALDTALARQPEQSFVYNTSPESMYVERRFYRPSNTGFRGRGMFRGLSNRFFRGSNRRGWRGRGGWGNQGRIQPRSQSCIVCGRVGCWPANHPEQREAFKRQYFVYFEVDENDPEACDQAEDHFEAWVVDEEGIDQELQTRQEIGDAQHNEVQAQQEGDTEETALTTYTSAQYVQHLDNESIAHNATWWITITGLEELEDTTQFTLQERYTEVFQGILPDTGAASVSTAGEPQFNALRRRNNTVRLDTSARGKKEIKFGIGKGVSIGST